MNDDPKQAAFHTCPSFCRPVGADVLRCRTMAKRTKEKKHVVPDSEQTAGANPFASLAGLRDHLPLGDVVEDPPTPSAPVSKSFAAKVVLSHQRKGHGGKTVTVLSGVLLMEKARKQFIRELGKALGTSVRAEGDDIIMSGDQRDRARAWLEAQGSARVVISG